MFKKHILFPIIVIWNRFKSIIIVISSDIETRANEINKNIVPLESNGNQL